MHEAAALSTAETAIEERIRRHRERFLKRRCVDAWSETQAPDGWRLPATAVLPFRFLNR